MLSSTTRGFKGRGRLILDPLSGGGAPFDMLNSLAVTENIEVDRTSRQNYMSVAGGELDVVETINSYTVEIQVNDITPENLAAAYRGTLTDLASAAVSNEEQDAWDLLRIALDYIPDPDNTLTAAINAADAWQAATAYAVGDLIVDGTHSYMVTVAGTSGGSAPTWPTDLSTVADNTVTWKDLGTTALVADTDYSRTAHGIVMLSGATARFPADTAIPIKVSYTRNAQHWVSALTSSGIEYKLTWHGLNANDSGLPVKRTYFRVKFSPTSGFSIQGGDDFATLTLTGTVLSDETRTGTGESTYQETLMV